MKRKIATLLMSLVIMFGMTPALQVAAIDIFPNCGQGSNSGTPDVCNEVKNQRGNSVVGAIKTVINILSYAIGIAAIIILVISGLRMVLDGDDPKAVEQARSGIIYALAGVAITVIAQSIVVFILNKL